MENVSTITEEAANGFERKKAIKEEVASSTVVPGTSQATTEPAVPKDFASAIYQAFESMFSNKNPSQLFCLNWPGTVLDYNRIQWKEGDGLGGNMPEEALIRQSLLLDQYVPPAQITQPDGTSVSERYKQAIRQLAPIPNKHLLNLQSIIRSRLNKTTVVTINGDKKDMTLIDYFSYLYKKWVDAKQEWGTLQQEKMDQLQQKYQSASKNWWNEYLVWYENNAEGYIRRINAAHEEILVSFPLTEWTDAIAILGTTDDGGLGDAKVLMDNAQLFVPHQEGVAFTPATGIPYNWTNQLKPSTNFIDLLADPESQKMGLDNALANVRQQITAWMAILPQVDDDAVKNAAIAFSKAEATFANAQKELLETYNKNTVEAVRIFCDIMKSRDKSNIFNEDGNTDDAKETKKEVDSLADELNKATPDNSKTPGGKDKPASIDWDMIKDIAKKVGDGQNELIGKQSSLTAAGKELASAAIKFLEVEGKRSSKFEWIKTYIEQLVFTLDELKTQVANHASAANTYYKYLNSPGNKKNNSSDKFGDDSFPNRYNSPENYVWAENVITINKSQMKSASSLSTFFKETQWGVNFFLGSAGGNTSVSGSKFAEEYMSETSEISIGFLATKVLIDRPWMKPEVFNYTANYFRTVQTPISPQKPISKEMLMGSGAGVSEYQLLTESSFPAYPVAILLVKDVVIKVKLDTAKTERARQTEKAVKSEGGGFLCFNVSKSESSQTENESMGSYFMAGQMISRAPAPQIVGYWLQLTPPDQSKVLDTETAAEIANALGFLEKVDAVHATPRMQNTLPQPK